jgi:hypothetical protein
MPCPFLKEAQVKYCRSSSIRKLIPLAQAGRAEERCTSENYRACRSSGSSRMPRGWPPSEPARCCTNR